MAKYKMINWQTVPFKRKSFKGQLDRYAKCCVVCADNPKIVLEIIPLFGFGRLMKMVQNMEQGIDSEKWKAILEEPVDGEFVEVKSHNGPLFHRFTKEEAQYGLCSAQDVGKAERLDNLKVKVYHSIKVFTYYIVEENTGNKQLVDGWYPDQMYNLYFGYRYIPLSDLTEPLQL